MLISSMIRPHWDYWQISNRLYQYRRQRISYTCEAERRYSYCLLQDSDAGSVVIHKPQADSTNPLERHSCGPCRYPPVFLIPIQNLNLQLVLVHLHSFRYPGSWLGRLEKREWGTPGSAGFGHWFFSGSIHISSHSVLSSFIL